MGRCRTPAALVWVALLFSADAAWPQDYLFSVPKMDMQVEIQPDASARIVYDITFQNSPRGHVIDVVDIGAPTADYQLRNVRASSGPDRLGDIRVSEFVDPGFEVRMDRHSIPPGGAGSLRVEFTTARMVWQDTTREDYASFRITPTWFGERYVLGTTQLRVAVHLPKGVNPEEVLYQGQAFDQKVKAEEGVSVVWQWPATRLTEPHLVAVSFPKRAMDRVVEMSALDLLVKWFSESTTARWIAAAVFFAMFGFAFFRFTGGTGVSVFVVLSALLAWLFVRSPGWHLSLLPMMAGLLAFNEWLFARRKASYMPPIAEVEGGGIKRGLTAPEAAALLELPLGRVVGLILFGMLKKGLLRQVQAEPLIVEVDEDFRSQRRLKSESQYTQFYRAAGQKKGIVIHRYEHPFLFLVNENPGKPVDQINFAIPLRQLIERTAVRMKGFDVSDTQDYYRRIVRRAVEHAREIGDIRQREERIDRDFEWILIDDDYPTVFTHGPYRPIWTRGTTTWTPSAGGTGGSAGPGIPGKTSLGDVSASFAGWTENTMGGLAAAISPGSLQVDRPSGGFINLSGADRLTGEFFQALAEGSKGHGGGGGGGCACAGCACACACAGGGR
ncbi:MAG: hypothetical protein GXY83_16110 [Rhodopirellula sp.]|nr:hypothetical protein [Rhodopirellula sp.]